MTRTEQNEIIIRYIGNQIQQMEDVPCRVETAFTNWFQRLVAPSPTPVTEKEETSEAA